MTSKEEIKKALISSCISFDPEFFRPYLFSERVLCDGEKKPFYRFFKRMVCTAKANSEGPLHLKIERWDKENPNRQFYCFYDAVHVHSRLTIIIEEHDNALWLDILPF